MDADDLFQLARLDVFRHFSVEKQTIECVWWRVNVTTCDPTYTYESKSATSLASAINSLFVTINHHERSIGLHQ